jgi:hypothetical protein
VSQGRNANTRIYVVANTNDGVERLVRAPNKSRAVKGSVLARIASQDDLQRLLAVGVVVENDTAPPPRSAVRRRSP